MQCTDPDLRALMAQLGKVGDGFARWPKVHSAALAEQQQLVEQLEDVGARLVNGRDHGRARPAQCHNGTHDAQRVGRIEPRSGLIQEQHSWACDQFNTCVADNPIT